MDGGIAITVDLVREVPAIWTTDQRVGGLDLISCKVMRMQTQLEALLFLVHIDQTRLVLSGVMVLRDRSQGEKVEAGWDEQS